MHQRENDRKSGLDFSLDNALLGRPPDGHKSIACGKVKCRSSSAPQCSHPASLRRRLSSVGQVGLPFRVRVDEFGACIPNGVGPGILFEDLSDREWQQSVG